jgi:hypothetical protein
VTGAHTLTTAGFVAVLSAAVPNGNYILHYGAK